MYAIQHNTAKVFLTEEGKWKVFEQCPYPMVFTTSEEADIYCNQNNIDGSAVPVEPNQIEI